MLYPLSYRSRFIKKHKVSVRGSSKTRDNSGSSINLNLKKSNKTRFFRYFSVFLEERSLLKIVGGLVSNKPL
ncbi:hypothetical protein [Chlamydia felis Fe/C-56]|uniref:Uncharacterized protein n=1 Tax=Chlamydia felis (strain Fe/C-56) TaxID=264202 RepID=Q252N2_CHLFF|nr:hypothetical protein [Chlamydia felis Fe/C-56]